MDGLAIYAAVVSTATRVWKIYEYYDNKKGKLKICIDRHDFTTEPPDIFHQFEVVNMTNRKVVIKDILIVTGVEDKKSYKIENPTFISYKDLNDVTFPLILDGGLIYKISISDRKIKALYPTHPICIRLEVLNAERAI
jgi:hypothetical protein